MSSRPAVAAWPRQLPAACALVLAALLLLCSVALDVVLLPRDAGLGHDFSAFYAAGLTLRHGHDPYSWTQLGATEAHLRSIGDPRRPMGFNPYANPPLFTRAMAALTVVPQRLAYFSWLVAMAAAMLVSMALLTWSYGMRRCGRPLLLFAATPAAVIGYFLGQQTPMLLLGLTAALVALRRGRPELAAVALSVAWVKPHLLLPLALVLAVSLRWAEARRLLVCFVGVGALLAVVSWLMAGGRLLGAWVGDLTLYGRTLDTIQPDLSSLAGLYLSVVGRPWSSFLAAVCAGTWLLFVALLARHSRRKELGPRDDAWLHLVALALAAWLLATPYAHPADLVLLAPALPVLLGRRLEGLADARVRLALGLLLVAPEADLLGFRPNFVLSYSVLVPLTMLLALRPWQLLRSPGV